MITARMTPIHMFGSTLSSPNIVSLISSRPSVRPILPTPKVQPPWATYLQELDQLDTQIRSSLKGLTNRKIVTFHDAFPYFCRRYDLELVGVVEEVPSVDPSPKYLAQLSQAIRKQQVRMIFSEPQFHPRLIQRLASDLSIGVAELDVLETGSASRTFYIDGLRRNLRTLESALR